MIAKCDGAVLGMERSWISIGFMHLESHSRGISQCTPSVTLHESVVCSSTQLRTLLELGHE